MELLIRENRFLNFLFEILYCLFLNLYNKLDSFQMFAFCTERPKITKNLPAEKV